MADSASSSLRLQPELLLLLLLEEGEHVLLEWALGQKSEISDAILFLIESDLLNSKQSQIIRQGTFSEKATVTSESVCTLLRDKQSTLLGLGDYAYRSLSELIETKVPLTCSLASLTESLWSRIAAALDMKTGSQLRRFLRSFEIIRSSDPLSDIPTLTLNAILVSETDMRYFQAFLAQSSPEDARLTSLWQQVNRSLLQIEELKARAYGAAAVQRQVPEPSILTPLRTKVKGGHLIDKRAPSSSLQKISQMSLEDAAWSLGCLLSSAKEIKILLGDMSSPTWVTDKQTVDLLVLLERTEFIDESSFSSIMTLDPLFIHDVVATLESIFRQFETGMHEQLQLKFTAFSQSSLFLEMTCAHRLEHSPLVDDFLTFRSVLKNVTKTGVLTWTGGFGSTLVHFGPFVSERKSPSEQFTANGIANIYGLDSGFEKDNSSVSWEILRDTVTLVSPTLLARILMLLLSNSSLTLLSSSTTVLKNLANVLQVLLSPFQMYHMAVFTPESALSSPESFVVDINGKQYTLSELEAILTSFEERKKVASNVSSGKLQQSEDGKPPISKFLQPTALLTCLYTPHYSARGPLIDNTFVIDVDRCQILSNPIGQEAILLTLEPCYLHNLAGRMNRYSKYYLKKKSEFDNIRASFKLFLLEAILRFIPSHISHFPVEEVIAFDVESFFRDIDVDDARLLYNNGEFGGNKREASSRALPRSKAFYYAFVDSPYLLDLLIKHGLACIIDYHNYRQ